MVIQPRNPSIIHQPPTCGCQVHPTEGLYDNQPLRTYAYMDVTASTVKPPAHSAATHIQLTCTCSLSNSSHSPQN